MTLRSDIGDFVKDKARLVLEGVSLDEIMADFERSFPEYTAKISEWKKREQAMRTIEEYQELLLSPPIEKIVEQAQVFNPSFYKPRIYTAYAGIFGIVTRVPFKTFSSIKYNSEVHDSLLNVRLMEFILDLNHFFQENGKGTCQSVQRIRRITQSQQGREA